MNEMFALKRRIFASVMSSVSILVTLIFAAWLMRTGLSDEHWSVWRIALLAVPYMAVRHFHREYDSYWELIVEIFLSHFIVIIYFLGFCAVASLYYWRIYIPDGEVLLTLTYISGVLTFILNEMAL